MRMGTLSHVTGHPAFEPLEPRLLLTDVSGHLTADTVWDNTTEPYVLVGNLYVDSGATLTLSSGTTLRCYGYGVAVDGRLEGTGATLEIGAWIDVRGGSGRGGRLDLHGGTVRSGGWITVRNWAEADFEGVTFADVPTVIYESDSLGTVDNGHGSWDLNVASTGVSVVNFLVVRNLTVSQTISLPSAAGSMDISGDFAVSAPLTLPDALDVGGRLTLAVPVTVSGGTLGSLAVSSSATVTASTIGYADLNGGSPTLSGNTIGYVNFNGGTPTVSGNTLTDGTPIRIADLDLDTGGISGNTYTASDRWVGIGGTLDGARTLGPLDGLSKYYQIGGLTVAWNGVLTLSSGTTLRCYSYGVAVDGRLEGTGATLEIGAWIGVRGGSGRGGRLDLHGGTVRGGGWITVLNWAEADFEGVTFVEGPWGAPTVDYDAGSSGTLEYSSLRGLSVDSNADVWIANNDFSLAQVSLTGNPTAIVYLENNWWGSDDLAAIEARITDHADNTALPRADYTPWLWLPGISSNVGGFDVLEANPADDHALHDIYSASAFLDIANAGAGDVVVRHTSSVVNFKDPEEPAAPGQFGDASRAPFGINNLTAHGRINGDDCNFAVRAIGTLRINAEGDYSFGVHSDDGFSLRITGADFAGVRGSGRIVGGTLMYEGDTGDTSTIGHIHLTQGDYTVQLDYYENDIGPAFVELSWATGLHEGWDSSFVLLGQPVTINPPPVPRFYVTGLWPESGKTTDFVDVTFNDHADLTHFTSQDVTLVGPSGPTEVTSIEHVERSVYHIRYPYTALANGATYHLTIGPNVRDEDGRRMDQNLNGVFGEADDTYTATFTADLTPPRVVSTVPAGDVAGTVNYVDVIFSKPIDPATFTLSDVQFTSGYTAGPGLLHGVLPGAFNTMDPNPATDIQPGILAARGTAGAAWSDNTTQVYTGEILVGPSGTLACAENFDDSILLKIDGITWLNNSTWNEPTASGTIAGLTPGWHSFELRLGQGGGGVGPVGPWSNWGVGYDPDGSAGFSTNQGDYQEMIDDGTMNLFRALSAPTVTKVTDTRFRISFAAQAVLGQHVMTIGPDISDLVGNSMDQDRNGVRGEASDAYTATFNLVDVDLELSNLNVAAAELWAGDPVHVSWNGANRTGYELLGEWTDAVYLSADDTWDMSDVLLATVPHTGGLAAGAPYSQAVDVTIPGVLPGSYHIIVRADMYGQEKEAGRKGNNVIASAALPLHIHALPSDNTPVEGTQSTSDRSDYYILQLPLHQNVKLTLDSQATAGTNEIYVKYGAVPSRQDYDYRVISGTPDAELIALGTYGGTYYALVYADAISGSQTYELRAQASGLLLTSVTPDHHGTSADAVLTLTGAGFEPGTSVSLISPSGAAYPASRVEIDSFARVTAVFTAGTVPADTYSIRAEHSDGDSDELLSAFRMISGGQANLKADLVAPDSVGRHAMATLYVEYGNTGDVAMPAPLLVLSSGDPDGSDQPLMTLDPSRVVSGFWTSATPEGFSDTIQILASGERLGVLQPGESCRVPVYFAGLLQPWDFSDNRVEFNLGVLMPDNAMPVDWASLKSEMKPDFLNSAAWDAVWANFTAQAGSTWGDYLSMLDDNAAYMGRLGYSVTDVGTLLGFELRQADGLSPISYLSQATDSVVAAPGLPLVFERALAQPISRRYEIGPLGRGWTHNWQMSLRQESDGTVEITDMTGTARIFQPDSRGGGYFAQAGDHGTLTALGGGAFRLREQDGFLYAFRSDGRLDYVEDTNGNRITCGYTANLLTSLTHSAGQAVQIAYNAAGRIARLTDPDGRQTLFTYDAANEHLVSVQEYDGRVTRYSYVTGQGLPREHALRQIDFPGGTHRYFDYDTAGRLSETSRDGGAERITFTYDSAGKVTAIDALGNPSRFFFDNWGRIAKAEDALGDAVHLTYDSEGNLTRITDPAGRAYVYTYDSNGNLVRSTDALGNSTGLSYAGPFNRLIAITDANGNRTGYAYDSGGNLQSITYADGSRETWAYDAQGDPTTWTNRRGQPIVCTYDADGRLTRKTYADGSYADYVYDARGNLTSTVDPTGTTAFTYDANDYLVRIDYPVPAGQRGRWLQFTYDPAGRRATSLDQLGHRLLYHYDAAGRLERITDETAREIVHYTYDAAGRLSRKELGNGVYTTYDYDVAGQLLHLLNRQPDGTVLSRFDYTYDSRGRRISMTTLDGAWTYAYDDIGQLTHAVFAPAPGSTIPAQDLTYKYDALGNRVQTIENGDTTDHTTNNMNQYTRTVSSVSGETAYTFDDDGNLIREVSLAGTTTYTYDDENRLVAVSKGADAWAYTYDALGNRVATTENGTTTRFVIDPIGLGNVVGEYTASGSLIAHYDYGFGLLSRMDAAGASAYYTFDAIGNTSELTDASGGLLKNYAYAPFATILHQAEGLPNPFQFVGEYGVMNEGNGLEFMRARLYQSSVGRFITPDVIGLSGGDINLYRYALNSPLVAEDPNGTNFGCKGADLRFQWSPVGNTHLKIVPHVYVVHDNVRIDYGPKNGGALDEGEWTFTRTDLPNATPVKFPGWRYNLLGFLPTPLGFNCYFASLVGLLYFCNWSKPVDKPTPPPEDLDNHDTGVPGSVDPNQKTGPAGFSTERYTPSGALLPYRLDFENTPDATAPAQWIIVTDVLDSDLDLATFELTELAFANHLVRVPEGLDSYKTSVDFRPEGKNVVAEVDASLDRETRELKVTFLAIDPDTGWLPDDVMVGLLYPNDATGRGQGHISYTVMPKAGLPSGTRIENQASIVFDWNDPIDTPKVLNTLDAEGPTSHMGPLPPVTANLEFPVSWSGEDEDGGSGVASYDVYVSDNGGEYKPWLTATTATSATFQGTHRHTYAFYTVARDNVGHVEAAPAVPDALTTVIVASEEWQGSIDDRWESAANWSAGFVPEPATLVVVGGPCVNQPSLNESQTVKGIDLRAGGVLRLTLGGSKVLVTESLSIDAASAVLDLADNDLILDYTGGTAGVPSPELNSIRQWLASGWASMSWKGPGIISSAAAPDPITYGLGYAQNDMIFRPAPYTEFDGQAVDPSTILVKYTYNGDLNLDGCVDDNDVTIFGLFYDGGATTSHYWSEGDLWGYDGRVDDNDVTILGLTYGLGIDATLSEGTPATAVMAPVRPAVDVAPPPGVLGTAPTAPVFEADASSLATPDDDSSVSLLSTAPLVGAAPVTFLPAFTLPRLDGSAAMLTVSSASADGVLLVFGAGDEVAPSSSEPALAPGSEIVDLLALSALAL